MADRKVKVGVVGLGNMGTGHVKWLAELDKFELTAVCDIVPEKAKKFAKEYNVKAFTDAEKMIKSGLVEAITIAVPHYFHTPIAVSAMKHGLHVLTEKPIAVHKNDALKMIQAHKEHPEVVFAAMFQMRTNATYQKLRTLIQRGELGKILRINWIVTSWFRTQSYYDSGTWRATWKGEGGGVLLNQCPHHIDLYQWLFGVPSMVRATCAIGKYHKIEVEDEVTAYFEYPDGCTAVFITSTGEAPGTNRLEITCERGRVVVNGNDIEFTRNEIPTSEFRDTCKASFAFPPSWYIKVPVGESPDLPHKVVLDNFADAILNGAPLIAPAEEGLNSVELANAMLYSSMKHKDVKMPLNGDDFESMLQGLIKKSTFKKNETKASGADMAASFAKR